jgi:hypothetical protein
VLGSIDLNLGGIASGAGLICAELGATGRSLLAGRRQRRHRREEYNARVDQPARPSSLRSLAPLRAVISVGAAAFLAYALGRFVYYHFALADRLARLMTFL